MTERTKENRTAKRFKLEETGILYDVNFDRLPIKLIDISTKGMKIACVDLIADQEVVIEWNGMEVSAIVMWAIGEAAGLKFDEELEDNHPLLVMGD